MTLNQEVGIAPFGFPLMIPQNETTERTMNRRLG